MISPFEYPYVYVIGENFRTEIEIVSEFLEKGNIQAYDQKILDGNNLLSKGIKKCLQSKEYSETGDLNFKRANVRMLIFKKSTSNTKKLKLRF